MSDLVERLRYRAKTRNTGRIVSSEDTETMGYYGAGSASLDTEAADRIEALEAALWEVLDAHDKKDANEIAHAALAPEQDK